MGGNIEQIIADEVGAIEANPDADITPETKVTRPGRSRSVVFSVRLNPEEVDAVEAAAKVADVPASTLVRGLVLRGLAAERTDSPKAIVDHMAAELQQLRQMVPA